MGGRASRISFPKFGCGISIRRLLCLPLRPTR
jgi:hypothetical protein